MGGYYGGFLGNEGAMSGAIAGGPSFEIPRGPGALGGRSGEQLKRLYEGGTQQNKQLNEELMRRGIMGNMQGILNTGFYAGPQYGQAPAGFQNKIVS